MDAFPLPYLDRQQKRHCLAGLLEEPWAMLLDSAGNHLDYNRYDIFCAKPSVTLTFDGNNSHIEQLIASNDDFDFAKLKSTDPIRCLRELLQHYRTDRLSQHSLPFNGGWMGYISYDFGRFLEKIPTIATDDITLPQIQMGLYQWALLSDHQLKQTRLYNFGLDSQQWQNICAQISTHVKQNLQTSTQNAESSADDFALTSQWQSNTSQSDYYAAFDKIQQYITAGDCYQVNFAQRFCADYHGEVYSAYRQLAEANKAPFSAYLNFKDHQILSLSPERFIESHARHVKTQPIKGTRPRSSDKQQDQALADELKSSEKDRAENLMIVDLLRNDLSRTAAQGSVKVSELFGHYRFESVHHLISTVESDLAPQYDNFDLLATTLPGGSITGAPKIRAMEIIESLEPVRRNLYCGIIGYVDFCGNMDTNICIRTLIAKNNRLYCWAGGGLVADSQAETEYQETFDKLNKILPQLGGIAG